MASNLPEATPILTGLRAGHRGLGEHHNLWLAAEPRAASDERFSRALAAWDLLERRYRCTANQGCIWTPAGSCSEDAPVRCDSCVNTMAPALALQSVLPIGDTTRGP